MALLEWSPEYELGIPLLDDEHKEFFSYINELETDMMAGCSAEDPLSIIRNIITFTTRHFTDEEEHMRACSYPRTEEHLAQHERFVEVIRDFERRAEINPVGLSVELLNLLRDWTHNHVKTEDLDFARYYHEHS